MIVDTILDVGDIIYTWNPEYDEDDFKVIEMIEIVKQGYDYEVRYLSDGYEDVICTRSQLMSNKTNERNEYCFTSKEIRTVFKNSYNE